MRALTTADALRSLSRHEGGIADEQRCRVLDDAASRGLAVVIDTGDSVGWAITSQGRAFLLKSAKP